MEWSIRDWLKEEIRLPWQGVSAGSYLEGWSEKVRAGLAFTQFGPFYSVGPYAAMRSRPPSAAAEYVGNPPFRGWHGKWSSRETLLPTTASD